jgi:hypothetical protein
MSTSGLDWYHRYLDALAGCQGHHPLGRPQWGPLEAKYGFSTTMALFWPHSLSGKTPRTVTPPLNARRETSPRGFGGLPLLLIVTEKSIRLSCTKYMQLTIGQAAFVRAGTRYCQICHMTVSRFFL